MLKKIAIFAGIGIGLSISLVNQLSKRLLIKREIIPSHIFAYQETEGESASEANRAFLEIKSQLGDKFGPHFEKNELANYSIYFDSGPSTIRESENRTLRGLYVSKELSKDYELLSLLKSMGLNISEIKDTNVYAIEPKTTNEKKREKLLLTCLQLMHIHYHKDNRGKIKSIDEAIPPFGVLRFNDHIKFFTPILGEINHFPSSKFPRPKLSRLKQHILNKLLNKNPKLH